MSTRLAFFTVAALTVLMPVAHAAGSFAGGMAGDRTPAATTSVLADTAETP